MPACRADRDASACGAARCLQPPCSMTTTQTHPAQGVGSPISNEAYNVITALQSKLEGMEAYRKYAEDGHSDIWRQLTDSERHSVEMLAGELERLVRDGRFRMHASERAA